LVLTLESAEGIEARLDMSYDAPPEIAPPPEPRNGAAAAGKRLLDVAGSIAILLAVLPVMAAVAIAVLVSDGRPILYRQERIGRRGRAFTILKFRTMVTGAEQLLDGLQAHNERRGPLFKMAQDPRVTRIGRFLRDSSLDELPQLLNVIRGDMSLVGPRPALARETAAFRYAHVEARQRVRPGITGLWQISARDEAGFEEYERLDRMYVERQSLRLDIAILLRTVPAVLGGAVRRMAGTVQPKVEPKTSVPWQATAWYGRELRDAQPLPAGAGNSQER
jgi:lipopolysaccharide/colanic/teichoic acid biosynthesis glycosyltransferase